MTDSFLSSPFDGSVLLACCFVSVVAATALVAVVPSVAAERDEEGPLALMLSKRMHIRRKLQHVSSGLLILFLYARVVSRDHAASLLLAAAACLYAVHRLRLSYEPMQRALIRTFGTLIRPHELHHPPGAFWLLLGCGLCVALFGSDRESAESLWIDIPGLCLVVASIGDPLASFLGVMIGGRDRWRVRGKSIIAASISSLVCAVAARAFLLAQQCHDIKPSCSERAASFDGAIWSWSLLASVAGMSFEVLAIGPDDNLSVSLGAGTTLWIAQHIVKRAALFA